MTAHRCCDTLPHSLHTLLIHACFLYVVYIAIILEWDCNRAGRQLCCQCAPAPPHPSSPGHCASGLWGEPQCSSHHSWPSVHLGPGQIWRPRSGYLQQQQLASACCCFTRACLPGHNSQPCLSATACHNIVLAPKLAPMLCLPQDMSAVHTPSWSGYRAVNTPSPVAMERIFTYAPCSDSNEAM